ncbi:MAG: translation initiation factor IF-2 N-terminal domain-containing protein, partial [Oscillospiraceae bacterium]|nr:translation initiation factor IF-2 N-terminal domain-containing protein [Oscillospiraceae bacterium]
MLEKIRIKDIAAELKVPNKEIAEVLSHYFEGAKNLNSVLSEAELNVIFEHYSLRRGVENFDAFFALAEQRLKKEPPKAQPKAANAPPVTQKPKAAPPAAGTKKRPTKEERQASEELAKQLADKMATRGGKPQGEKAAKPGTDGPAQARTKGESRTVDTRSGSVNLEKYNERYEQIAPGQHVAQQGSARRPDSQVSKQKLTQKSKQYRKQGMRSRRHESEAERLRRIAAERAKKPQLVIK